MSSHRRRGAVAVSVVLLTSGGVSVAAAHDGGSAPPAEARRTQATWVPPSKGGVEIEQAPALPGAQAISTDDRVYTADQSSNTVSVINPATNEVLGTLPLGSARLDGVLGPVDTDQVNVHGLGFSRDGRYLDVVSVTSNAVQVVDTATNAVVDTTYVGRSPHEAFISPNGREVWTAVRGEDYISVVDLRSDREICRIETSDGPSKVLFSPDGRTAYVNHQRAAVLDVIDVRSKRITAQVPLTLRGSADFGVSPDGREVWLGHPDTGKTTVVDARTLTEKAVLDTGPRTNHPNFVTTADGAFTWISVGGLDEVKVYRRGDGIPELVDTIPTSGLAPHGLWPSPDNTRVYVALEKSDAVDVISTESRSVIATIPVGQDPQALVYVARSGGASSDGLSQQGLGQRVQSYPLGFDPAVPGDVARAAGKATVRNLPGLDEVDVTAAGLTPATAYDVFALSGDTRTKLLTATSDDTGKIPEALAFVEFFDNGYDGVLITQAQP